MAVGKVSDTTFESEVLKATGPVVVDFWAEWCGPCRMIAPALEEIAGTLNGKVKIVKLNVDENPQTAAKYGIMSIPTLMLFKNGELASRQVGAAPKQKLEQWITTATACRTHKFRPKWPAQEPAICVERGVSPRCPSSRRSLPWKHDRSMPFRPGRSGNTSRNGTGFAAWCFATARASRCNRRPASP